MLPEMSQDGIQPNAPVALVTMEIRHPATDSLTESTSRELKHLLINDLPIERQAQDVSWGVTAPGAAPTPVADRFVRYGNRDNTVSASLKNQAIVVETSAYRDFETFCDLVLRVADARAQVSSIVGVERIGLRYVLEIRSRWGSTAGSIGATGSTSSCSALPHRSGRPVADRVAGRRGLPGTPTGQVADLAVRPGVGQALDQSYHLRRITPPQAGPFFLMDIDSFWTPVGGSIRNTTGTRSCPP
ncbi:TIGR04255 family protein [Mycobacterium kansasii 732]|nr:TIGR04255 family protein [Mycobacterium kansasii 732]